MQPRRTHRRRTMVNMIAAPTLAATIALSGLALGAGDPPTANHGAHAAVDEAGLPLQPAYFGGRTVQFRNEGPAPAGTARADARVLYEVEYPAGWERSLARPLCFYCDHTGDGENAWDYHDHVLETLPGRRRNATGAVYWHVLHVQPAVTGQAAVDEQLAARYADLLPVTSAWQVRRLLAARLKDGTPVARTVDTTYIFRAPLTRR